MITGLAKSQNWKNNKEKKKPCPGRSPSPSSTRTPSAARALFVVEFPLYNRHGQAPISIDALHSQLAPTSSPPSFCSRWNSVLSLYQAICEKV
jgi:hypothetical protein